MWEGVTLARVFYDWKWTDESRSPFVVGDATVDDAASMLIYAYQIDVDFMPQSGGQ